MLLSESELNMYNADSVLNEAVLLDESESITKLPAIPVVENSRLGCGVVSFTDLDSIVEDYGCDYGDAFCAIAEQNELDSNSLAVSVEDYRIIESPELVGMVPNIVVKPISENNIVYQFCDYAVDALAEDAITDEEFYDAMLDEGFFKNFFSSKTIHDMGQAQLKSNPIQIPDVDGGVTDDNGTRWYTNYITGDKYGKTADGKILKQTTRLVRKDGGHLSKKAAAGYIAAGAGVALGATLAAKKIAALRKQQKKHPSMRGRIQKVIDALKKKLHR